MMSDLLRNENSEHTEIGSDRSFGFVFACLFIFLAIAAYINAYTGYIIPTLIIAGVFFLAALFAPSLLRPLNIVWFKFGLLLHKIISPIVLGALFFVSVTPVALIMRALGKYPLKLRLDPDTKSYWIHRDPPGPTASSMSDQF